MNLKNFLSNIFYQPRFSGFIHQFFPAECDLCFKQLTGSDFVRVCRRCVVSCDNVKTTPVCKYCYHPLTISTGKCLGCQLNEKENEKSQENNNGTEVGEVEEFRLQNISLFFNQGKAQDLVYQYKFFHHLSYSKIIALMIYKKHQNLLKQVDVLVPIILGRKGIYERDFCPVGEVIKRLGKMSGIPVLPVLKRNEKNYGEAQHHKNAKERKLGIQGKYLYLKKYQNSLSNQKVLLVDDVFTTGSTLQYGAELIRENNQDCEVIGFTFLKTLLDEKSKKQLG